MDRGAWWTIVHGVSKESDTTEQVKQQQICVCVCVSESLCCTPKLTYNKSMKISILKNFFQKKRKKIDVINILKFNILLVTAARAY